MELPLKTKDGLLFCPGNTCPIISLFSKQKTVVTIHDLSYLYFPSAYSFQFRAFYNLLIPRILNKSDSIITVSNSEKNKISSYYSSYKDKIKVVKHGIIAQENETFSSENIEVKEKVDKVKPYMLYVGSLSKRKNIEGVIKAFEIINKQVDIDLFIVGGGNNSFNKADIVINDELSRNIKFLGHINDKSKLFEIYENAKCLLFPSFYESFGFPVLEAMLNYCPVIASDIPALNEICEDKAILCDPYDVADIANKTLLVLKDEKVRNKLVKEGYNHAIKFTWKKAGEETLNVIKEVL